MTDQATMKIQQIIQVRTRKEMQPTVGKVEEQAH